jgi:hypothetical protein
VLGFKATKKNSLIVTSRDLQDHLRHPRRRARRVLDFMLQVVTQRAEVCLRRVPAKGAE